MSADVSIGVHAGVRAGVHAGGVGDPKFRHSTRGVPYTPGMYDAMLPIREHPRPEELRAITIELAASGRALILSEELRAGGPAPRHLLALDEPQWVFMALADGREVAIEIMLMRPDEPDKPGESGEPGELEPEPASAPEPTAPAFRRLSFMRPAGGKP